MTRRHDLRLQRPDPAAKTRPDCKDPLQRLRRHGRLPVRYREARADVGVDVGAFVACVGDDVGADVVICIGNDVGSGGDGDVGGWYRRWRR